MQTESAQTQETDTAQSTSETVSYTPGVYTTPVTLGDSTVDIEVTVDKNHINDIRMVNLSEATAAALSACQAIAGTYYFPDPGRAEPGSYHLSSGKPVYLPAPAVRSLRSASPRSGTLKKHSFVPRNAKGDRCSMYRNPAHAATVSFFV